MIAWQLVIFVTLICLAFAILWELGEEAIKAMKEDERDD